MRIVLGDRSLIGYPKGGGYWTIFLQYLLGLADLGHDVFLLELYRSTDGAAGESHLIDLFFRRMEEYGLRDRCAVLAYDTPEQPTLGNTRVCGPSAATVRDVIERSDLMWNFCAAVDQPLLSLFRHRVFVDLDPGHLQVSALTCHMGLDDHDVFVTVGAKLHDDDCQVPTLGRTWHRYNPFVFLPMWSVAPDPGPLAPFSSVTQWNWGELWLGDRVLSIAKRDAYLRYLDLPRQAGRPFELAANIHPADNTGDRRLLEDHNWKLVDPNEQVASPSAYQAYIARSRAELSCPKPVFRELKTGWLSDRSACYLASGRPVLAEDTGFSDYLPTGKGLLAFRNIAEAIAGTAEIDGNYAAHSRSAREFAEEFLDSGKCLTSLLAVSTQ